MQGNSPTALGEGGEINSKKTWHTRRAFKPPDCKTAYHSAFLAEGIPKSAQSFRSVLWGSGM